MRAKFEAWRASPISPSSIGDYPWVVWQAASVAQSADITRMTATATQMNADLDARERQIEAANAEIARLTGELAHWKASHADMVNRCAFLSERPDLPVDRISAFERMNAEIARLNRVIDVAEFRIQEARDETVAIIAAAPVRRECNACSWMGEADTYCGSVGPLCPECHETTEPVQAQGVALNDQADIAQIYELFGIGSQARNIQMLMVNLRNTMHFADLLHAVEREFFMVPGELDDDHPDDEPFTECLLNCWGSTVEQYVERFRALLAASGQPVTQGADAVSRLDYDMMKLTLDQTLDRLRQAEEAIVKRDATALRVAQCAGEFAREAVQGADALDAGRWHMSVKMAGDDGDALVAYIDAAIAKAKP
jgi:hypothetical protein